MRQDEIIKQFKEYLQNTGYSTNICNVLPELVKDFLNCYFLSPKEITTDHIQDYYEWLQIRPHKKRIGGLSEVYIQQHIFALKTFLNWQEAIGEVKYNPISVMRFKSPKSNPRQPLSIEEIKALFEVIRTEKEKAVLHLFYSCGLRRSEAEALNIKDLHFKQQTLYVRAGKGAKRRAVPMPTKVTQELESYFINERTSVKNNYDQEAFILNKQGSRMRGNSYNGLLKRLISRTSLNPETSLHHLRHSIATHLLESGLSLEDVRDFLGHSYLESTQIYTKVKQSQLSKL